MTTTALTEHEDPGLYWFRPRPDQPERFDEQTSFVESRTTGVKWLVGGNGSGTTTCSLYAAARFMLSTPPPRRDTPFFIMSTDFTTVMESCWAEKLEGMQLLPSWEIDYDRIVWFKQGPNWPRRVPLKEWPGRPGKNWVIEFRSYDQGRKRQQARSIGGFLFVEQFPWSLLTEVLRGCREYNFPGSKMCEFTPIDPSLCADIEEMIENGPQPATPEPGRRYMPPGWELYRCNTECAMEAGHISREWYDEFFGMIPDEMVETRKTGAFASYEGAIYKGFNPSTHCRPNAEFMFPPDAFHRRVIDWGSGGDHPFVCLWAYYDSGTWWVYDEIYDRDRRTTPEYLRRVVERSEQWGWDDTDPHFGVTWADTAEPGSMLLASELNHLFPECRSISIAGARKRIHPGIEHVQLALKSVPGTGLPGLIIHRDNCPNTRREFRAYRWLASVETGLNPRLAAREPLDRDNHTMDCVRYLIFSEAESRGLEITRKASQHSRPLKSYGIQLARPDS